MVYWLSNLIVQHFRFLLVKQAPFSHAFQDLVSAVQVQVENLELLRREDEHSQSGCLHRNSATVKFPAGVQVEWCFNCSLQHICFTYPHHHCCQAEKLLSSVSFSSESPLVHLHCANALDASFYCLEGCCFF